MFKISSILFGLVIAAGAAALLLGDERSAEARSFTGSFIGTVLVDGAAPPKGGELIVETIAGKDCGFGKVQSNGETAFLVAVAYSDIYEGCFATGDPIIFKFNGMKAQQTPAFTTEGTQYIYLTFKTPRYFQCTPELCPISAPPMQVVPPKP